MTLTLFVWLTVTVLSPPPEAAAALEPTVSALLIASRPARRVPIIHAPLGLRVGGRSFCVWRGLRMVRFARAGRSPRKPVLCAG